MILSSQQPFIRDRLTWMAYAMLAYIGFTQSMLGPLMPFLRNELSLNYTQGGLLPASIAVGLILSGLSGDSFAQRWGRRVVFWGGALGLATAALLLGLSHYFGMVIIAVLGIGFGSSLTQVMIQALLADQHGERRSIAFTEANVAASLSTTLTPLVIGGLQSAGAGWRVISALVVFFLTLLAVIFHRQSIPDSAAAQSQSVEDKDKGHLPFSFWLYWIVLFLVVAVEMSMAVWGTDFLFSVAGLSRVDAALGFSAFPAAMLIGRIAGSRLTRRWSSLTLLIASLALTLIGFPIFWLARLATLNILGLFITGLGIASMYPLTLSLAVGLAPGQSNLASARVSLGVGTALLTAPLLLGWLADRIGLQSAYSMVIVLMIAAFAIVMNNRWLSARKATSPL
jgi:fucose permease